MEQTVITTMTVNGTQVTRSISARQHLVDFLRDELGLTGSHLGCEGNTRVGVVRARLWNTSGNHVAITYGLDFLQPMLLS